MKPFLTRLGINLPLRVFKEVGAISRKKVCSACHTHI